MNISIDYGIRTPIYMQIVLEIEKLIALGLLKAGEQIPSIRDTACMLGINPNTVKKAYDLLEMRGIIISKSTKGTFITENINLAIDQKIQSKVQEIKNLIKELENMGLSYEEIMKKIK